MHIIKNLDSILLCLLCWYMKPLNGDSGDSAKNWQCQSLSCGKHYVQKESDVYATIICIIYDFLGTVVD